MVVLRPRRRPLWRVGCGGSLSRRQVPVAVAGEVGGDGRFFATYTLPSGSIHPAPVASPPRVSIMSRSAADSGGVDGGMGVSE